jgi:EAL domain-containing protein (putative c-di-GMP-specific phosphodiesterase class I)
MFKLVSAIVVLCQDLDALVVAEGIETIDELTAVCDAGATYGQGYLLARPAFPPPAVAWPGELGERIRKTGRITRRSLTRRRR